MRALRTSRSQERPWGYVAGEYAILPKVISGLRKSIAIQAAISLAKLVGRATVGDGSFHMALRYLIGAPGVMAWAAAMIALASIP
jgi:hypothetical protein